MNTNKQQELIDERITKILAGRGIQFMERMLREFAQDVIDNSRKQEEVMSKQRQLIQDYMSRIGNSHNSAEVEGVLRAFAMEVIKGCYTQEDFK